MPTAQDHMGSAKSFEEGLGFRAQGRGGGGSGDILESTLHLILDCVLPVDF